MSKRYTNQQRGELLAVYRSGGLSQRAFCEANAISLSTFGYWLRKERQAGLAGRLERDARPQAVVELDLSLCGGAAAGRVTIQLPSQVLIHCRAEQAGVVLEQIARAEGSKQLTPAAARA